MPRQSYQIFSITNWVGGLRMAGSPILLDDTQFPDCTNIEIFPEGMVRKRSGSSQKNPNCPATGADYGSAGAWFSYLFQFWMSSGTNYLIGTITDATSAASADLVRFNSSMSEYYSILGTPASGFTLRPTDMPVMEQMNDYLLVGTPNEKPIYWDGNASSTCFTLLAAPITQFMKHFKDFLFFANVTDDDGNNFNSRIQWCDTADPFTWPVANYLDLDADDGDEITGMEILGDALIVFKERKIFEVRYVEQESDFEYELKIDGRGSVAGASITSIFNDLVFLAEDGIYAFDGQNLEDLSYNIKSLILDIAPDYRSQVTSAPLEEMDQLWFIVPYKTQPTYIPGSGDTLTCSDYSMATNNLILVYNYDKENWVKIGGFSADAQEDFSYYAVTLGFYYNYSDLAFSDMTEAWSSYDMAFGDRLLLSGTSILLSTDYHGYIYQHNSGDSDGGDDFVGMMRTKWYDMGSQHTTKRLYRATLLVDRNDGISLTVKVRTDWRESSTPDLSTTISCTGIGTQYLDTEIVRVKIDKIINFHSVQFEFRTDSADMPWGVHGIILEYREVGRTPIVRTS